MSDNINPTYYRKGIETTDYIVSHSMNYLEGNIIKYVTRYKDKGGLEDLKKAKWYLARLIQEAEKPDFELSTLEEVIAEEEISKFINDTKIQYKSFTTDKEKMRDFEILTKEEFLNSYSYITEAEYDLTVKENNNES
tara:strand:- start:369 stop:779 length:411 start_codon:yes stop_codon:yes gene_type:complete